MIGLQGNVYGPGPLHITTDRVAEFVAVTGDDPDRWTTVAPPGLAAAALFVVAPDLIEAMAGHSVIHGEQTFTWHAPIGVGSTLDVTGSVSRVRERGGVFYIGFDILASDGDRPVLEGSSMFLVTGASLPAESTFERPEPPHSYRGEPGPYQIAASRADLVKYAAVTGDWNPIHWDHEAAVAAGLPGVVVHGLLQCSWALRAGCSLRPGPQPLASAKARFRNPLLPARPVNIGMVVAESEEGVAQVSLHNADVEYLNARVELADG